MGRLGDCVLSNVHDNVKFSSMVDVCTAGAAIPNRLAIYEAEILLIVGPFSSSVIDVRLSSTKMKAPSSISLQFRRKLWTFYVLS